MSAGVCGKRVGFEEIFGSSSPTACSSAKRSRWSSFGSPTRSEFGSGHEDSASVLLQMFPGVGAEAPSFDDFSARVDSATIGNCSTVPDERTATCSQMSHEKVDEATDAGSAIGEGYGMHGSKWVDMFVQEMGSAVDVGDARIRAARILEAFEHNVTVHSRESEELKHASLKGHLQSLVNDNQILKRAVAIQHERNLEQEEKTREVHQLKHVLCQYQEQIQSLEVRNYTLNLHLQRAQSVSGHFHQDIF
ncbi:hypothetical protein SDJN03_04273, partial [Cucurbita argyrosperma subsp. sororia]